MIVLVAVCFFILHSLQLWSGPTLFSAYLPSFLSLTEQFHLTHAYVGSKAHKNLGNQNICSSKNNIYIIFGHCLKVTHGKTERCRTDQPDKTVQSNTTQHNTVSCEHIANHYVEQTFANRPTFHWPVKHNQRCLCYWGNITV